ncbi:MAG TPA: hypothetical protein VFZ61_02910 [Polyangiales bacterium]
MKPAPTSRPEDETEWTPASLFDPLAQLEVATRIHNASLDWMARSWQQWLQALMTMTPLRPVESPPVEASERAERAMAREGSKRSPRTGIKPRPRARG